MKVNSSHSNTPQKTGYTFDLNKKMKAEVHPKRLGDAVEIDSNKDRHLSDAEIKKYLRKEDILRDPKIVQVDEAKILDEYKTTLQNKPLPQASAYHTYESMTAELTGLSEKYPDLCDLVSLGKTHEGRDIWALKISKKPEPEEVPEEGAPKNEQPNPENPEEPPAPPRKHGILITGLHHAREWISMEVPMFTAKALLENYETDPKMKERVDNTEIWIAPMVNPDGYEYSRTENSWWRKNRAPVTQTACDLEGQGALSSLPGGVGTSERADGEILGYGVDLNRNYYDGNPDHFYLYRAEGDTPCSTWDDDGASDRISSSTYRGPEGGTEKEVAAMTEFQLENKNIKATIDFHSYGRMILYPWGYGYDQVENVDQYREVGANMAKIINEADEEHVRYDPMQSSGLYPARGTSEDFEHANGIMGFTFELGRSFAPYESEIGPISRRLLGAQLYLIDHVMKNGGAMRPDMPETPETPGSGSQGPEDRS